MKNRWIIGLFRLFLLSIPLWIVAYFALDHFFKSKGYDGVIDFASHYWSAEEAPLAKVDQVKIIVDEDDLAFMAEKRREAMERGIQINEGDNYVKGYLVFQGDTSEVEFRLKGHMMDHLQPKKWSFRVKMKEGKFKGMYRFTFQHPGTRAYANEWVYHQMMKEEGVIALQYEFFNLKINDEDWGIYAVEEHFGPELLAHNNRPNGVVMRWNPNLYWYGRIHELQKEDYAISYHNMESSFPEPYDRGSMMEDSVRIENYYAGMTLLEDFRRGYKSTSEVFDVELLARFHAIIDLVGGHHSLDWSDVKYYYNTLTKKIEPVAYESFSLRPTKKLAGQRQYLAFGRDYLDFHDRLFSDMQFFKAYVDALERISDASYLDQFFENYDEAIQKRVSILNREFAFKRFESKGYYKNQLRIQKLLDVPQGIHAFYHSVDSGNLIVQIAATDQLPLEIYKLEHNGKEIALREPVFIQPKPTRGPMQYEKVQINGHGKVKAENKVKIYYRVVGSDQEKVLEAAKYRGYEYRQPEEYKSIADAQNVSIDMERKEIIFNGTYLKGNWTVPYGYHFVLVGQKVTLDSVKLNVEGQISIHGNEEKKLLLKIQNSTIRLEGGSLQNTIENVEITAKTKGDLIQLVRSNVAVKNVNFSGEYSNGIQSYQSNYRLVKTNFTNASNNAIEDYQSHITIRKAKFKNIEGNAIETSGGVVDWQNGKVEKSKRAVMVKDGGSGIFIKLEIEDCKKGFEVKDQSAITIKNSRGKDLKIGIEIDDQNRYPTKSNVTQNNWICQSCKEDEVVK